MKTKHIVTVLGLLVFCAFIATFLWVQYASMEDTSPRYWTRLDLKYLEQAVRAHHLLYAEWPESLEVLTKPHGEGKPPLLKDPSMIIDGWHRPFHYDRTQLHPVTGEPLIWSEGPHPGRKGSKVTNWDALRGN
ncbi:MAG TPA: hypothetical protein VE988_17495 [Gemmataceae bacterium]|nr:hypothetical protein [Gemmataceae bacterium]